MSSVQIIQLIIILGYFAVLLFVTRQAGPKMKTGSDFLLAGRQMGWVIIAAGLAGTHFSGGVVTSIASLGYKYGLGGMWFELSTVIGFIIAAFLYAKRARLAGAYTMSEMMEIRFDDKTRVVMGLCILLAGIAAAAAQFKGIGLIVNTMFGVPENVGIIISWIVVCLYMMFAGFWATNLTNIPQLLFCAISFPLIFIFAIIKFGGWNTLSVTLAEVSSNTGTDMFSYVSPGFVMIATWILMWMWVNEWGSQWYWQRAAAARNTQQAKFGFFITALIMLITCGIPILGIGMYARVLNPDLVNAELALSTVLVASPAILGGVATAGIFAAAMSTVDGCAMGGITVIVRDIYQRFLKPNATPKQLTNVSRVTTLVVLTTIIFIATSLKSALAGLSNIFIFNTGIFPAIVASLYWKKAKKEGALLSILFGGIFATIWMMNGGSQYFHGAWWAFSVSTVTLVIVSLIVEKTGPWWGKEEIADSIVEKDILEFISNRKASFADIIDRLDIDAKKIRYAIQSMTMKGILVEIDCFTYALKQNLTSEELKEIEPENSSNLKPLLSSALAICLILGVYMYTH